MDCVQQLQTLCVQYKQELETKGQQAAAQTIAVQAEKNKQAMLFKRTAEKYVADSEARLSTLRSTIATYQIRIKELERSKEDQRSRDRDSVKRFQQEAFDVEIGELEIVALHERLLAESVHNVGMTHRGRSDTDVGTVVSGIRLRGFLALFRAMLEEHTDAASVWRVLRRFSYARATAAKCAHLDVSTMSGREERLQRILAAAEREGSETAMATTDTPAKWRRGAKVTDL
jgi:hypothetical protein